MSALEKLAWQIYTRFPRTIQTSDQENAGYLKQSFKAAAFFMSRERPHEVQQAVAKALHKEDTAKGFEDANPDAIDWASLGIDE